jgi:hypothetical protein
MRANLAPVCVFRPAMAQHNPYRILFKQPSKVPTNKLQPHLTTAAQPHDEHPSKSKQVHISPTGPTPQQNNAGART